MHKATDNSLALDRAIKEAGSAAALARKLKISRWAVCKWEEVPPRRVLAVEAATGISRHELRPDVFGPAEAA